MSTRLLCQLAMAGVLLALAPAAAAQTATSPQCQTLHTYVSVLKPDGHALTTLTAADFEAETGGKPAQVTAAALHVPEHRVFVLLDHSGSMSGDRWNVAVALARDLDHMLPAKMPIGIYWFDTGLHQLVPLTRDHNYVDRELKTFLLTGPAPGSRTQILDAVDQVLKAVPTHHAGDIVYVLTDGEDNHSIENFGEVAKALAASSTRLFAGELQYGEPGEFRPEDLRQTELRRSAEKSGGSFFKLGQDIYQFDEEQFQLARRANFAMFESMVGDYELSLISGVPIAKPEKLKLHVHPRSAITDKIKMVYPEAILPSCP